MQHLLPPPGEIKTLYALTSKQKNFIMRTRRQVQDVLEGKDKRRLLIIGPCSLHDIDSSLELALHLKKLSTRICDKFLLLMRTFFEKPRTCLGWRGILHDPHLDGSCDIASGIITSRKLLLQLAEMELPAATEFLEPSTSCYLQDGISWGCIGARTCTSQPHRQMASGLEMPLGFKNTIDGDLLVGAQSVYTASKPQCRIIVNDEGRLEREFTKGNCCAHLILRGGKRPNFSLPSIQKALMHLKNLEIPPRLLIDCSHANSCYNPGKQLSIMKRALNYPLAEVKGFLLESHLYGDKQLFSPNPQYGISVTDACLGIQEVIDFMEDGAGQPTHAR